VRRFTRRLAGDVRAIVGGLGAGFEMDVGSGRFRRGVNPPVA